MWEMSIPPFSEWSRAAKWRGTCRRKLTYQLLPNQPEKVGPSARMVPSVRILISFSRDLARSLLESWATTRASSSMFWRSSPMTSMPPFLFETLSWPLTRGRVVRRSSQIFSLLPKKLLLWVLPSSPLQGPVVKDWACKGITRRSGRAYLTAGARLRMVISCCMKDFKVDYGEEWGLVPRSPFPRREGGALESRISGNTQA